MNDTIKSLKTRRSVRAFDGKKVEGETLDAILEAGIFAPSGMNRQKTILVAVNDEKTVELLSKINAGIMGSSGDPFYGAKTVVVVFADKTCFTCIEDGSLVMGNLLNAAHALGVDSCWIHRAKETFETEEGKALLKKWGISENYIGIGNCILGYGTGEYPQVKERESGRIVKI